MTLRLILAPIILVALQLRGVSEEDTKPPTGLVGFRDYQGPLGEDFSGNAFVIQYRGRLVACMSRHQFEADKVPSNLEDLSFGKLPLDSKKRFAQQDVQILPLTDQEQDIPYMGFHSNFTLKTGERLWIERGGEKGEGTFAKLHSQGLPTGKFSATDKPKELHALLDSPADLRGASGCAVIQVTTGLPVGVLLGADKGADASLFSFEPICLPDDGKGPAPQAPLSEETTQPTRGSYLTDWIAFQFPAIAKEGALISSPVPAWIDARLFLKPASDESGHFALELKPDYDVEPLLKAAEAFFKAGKQPLPGGFDITLATNSRFYMAENEDNAVAPLAMMLDSAMSGRALRERTGLFAKLEVDGTLSKPAQGWKILSILRANNWPAGFRLVVAEEALPELTAGLAYGGPGSLLSFEVIGASTFDEARELCYVDGQPEAKLAEAMRAFAEIQEKRDLSMDLPAYLSLAGVQNRLATVTSLSPKHLSANLLLQFAKGDAPKTLPREIALREIHSMLDPLVHRHVRKGDAQGFAKGIGRELSDRIKKHRDHFSAPEEGLLDELQEIASSLKAVPYDSSESGKLMAYNMVLTMREQANRWRAPLEKEFTND